MADNNKFLSYPSIESKLYGHEIKEFYWVGTEKIDGSNLYIKIDENGNIRIGSRNRFLDEGEDFQGHTLLIEKYKTDILKLAEQVRALYKPEMVILYAEIYGGCYKHPDVPKSKCKIIIGRVSYTPNIDLAFYDIRTSIKSFLEFDESRKLFEQNNLPTPPILFHLPAGEDMPDIEFLQSQVYLRHKLPKIDENYIEGVVLRAKYTRIKIKRSDFLETNHIRYAKKTPPNISDLPDPAQYVTESRMDSVISKLPNPTYSDIFDEYYKDVVKSYFTDHTGVTGQSKKLIRARIGELTKDILEKKWKNSSQSSSSSSEIH
jgi:hypothetical protein